MNHVYVLHFLKLNRKGRKNYKTYDREKEIKPTAHQNKTIRTERNSLNQAPYEQILCNILRTNRIAKKKMS